MYLCTMYSSQGLSCLFMITGTRWLGGPSAKTWHQGIPTGGVSWGGVVLHYIASKERVGGGVVKRGWVGGVVSLDFVCLIRITCLSPHFLLISVSDLVSEVAQ